MKRGFEAVLADLDSAGGEAAAARRSRRPAWHLVMKVGGASGPLYGTLFMTLGKELPAEPSRDDLVARAFGRGDRGGEGARQVGVGQKTMLDVLVPVREALEPAAAS